MNTPNERPWQDRGWTDTREERRALAFHQAVAKALLANPAPVRERASAHLDKLESMHPYVAPLFRRWREWLALPTDVLAARMTDPVASDMRHVSPFAGILSARERRDLLVDFGERERNR